MIPRHQQQGERGAAALSLLTVGILVAVAIFAVMAIPLTNAGDAKAKSRSAADAAALAGVESFKDQLVEKLRALEGFPPGGLTSLVSGLDNGMVRAAQYAERNGGRLVGYSGDPAFGTFIEFETYARVRGRDVEGQDNVSEARAKLDLPGCTLTEEEPDIEPVAFTRAEDDDEDEEDEEEEPPKPTFSLECDGETIFEGVEDLANIGVGGLGTLADLIDRSNAKLVE